MRNSTIDAGSDLKQILGVLTGTWSEFDRGEFHVVRTPFMLSLSAVLDSGSTELPFRFDLPVAATVVENNGRVVGHVIRPGDTAVHLDNPGLFNLVVFGAQASTSNLI